MTRGSPARRRTPRCAAAAIYDLDAELIWLGENVNRGDGRARLLRACLRIMVWTVSATFSLRTRRACAVYSSATHLSLRVTGFAYSCVSHVRVLCFPLYRWANSRIFVRTPFVSAVVSGEFEDTRITSFSSIRVLFSLVFRVTREWLHRSFRPDGGSRAIQYLHRGTSHDVQHGSRSAARVRGASRVDAANRTVRAWSAWFHSGVFTPTCTHEFGG